MINKIFLLFSVLIISNTHAQIGVKNSFLLASESIRSSDSFLGNGIVDILVKDNIVWAATGFGLNKSTNQGQTWESFSAGNYNSKGGVTAMTFMDDSTLWLATAFDTTAGDDDLSAGGGLSYTRDGGLTWTHVAQPVDPRETEDYKPTTTVIQNITFDIAFTSKLIRAQKTCTIMLEELGQADLETIENQALNERNYGDLTGLNKDDARRKWGDEQVHIWRRSFDVPPPGGESLKGTADRVLPYFREHILPVVLEGKSVLVAAHGNSLRALIMELEKIDRKSVV